MANLLKRGGECFVWDKELVFKVVILGGCIEFVEKKVEKGRNQNERFLLTRLAHDNKNDSIIRGSSCSSIQPHSLRL